MIRRWAMFGLVAALVMWLLWDFADRVVLHDPAEGIEGVEKPPLARDAAIGEDSQAWGREIVGRNLFSPQRGFTPPPPAAPEASQPPALPLAPPAPKPNLVLSGIILNQYGEFVAIVGRDKEPPVQLRKGDSLAGAEVVRITPRSVELRWQGETIRLSLAAIRKL